MKEYGGIQLPLTKVEKIPIHSDLDAIDFFLDIDTEDKFNFIRQLYTDLRPSINIQKAILYYRSNFIYMSCKVVILIMRSPHPIWWDYKGQSYLIFAGQNLEHLKRYFIQRKIESFQPLELGLLHMMIEAIDYTMRLQSNHIIRNF